MTFKIVFLVASFIVVTSGFSARRSEKISSLDNGPMFMLTGYDQAGSRSSGESGQQEGGRHGSSRNEKLEGGKMKIGYTSSEESSSESFEIRQVQKQYHDTVPYSNGNGRLVQNDFQPRSNKVMNLEDNFQDGGHNAIGKED